MGDDHDHPELAPRDQAISLIHQEHRSLARIVDALQTVTATVVETESAPDFALLSSMLYCIDAVPEKLHHLKEDRFLFAALRERDSGSITLIERLEQEHAESPRLVTALERSFVRWQGGARDGLCVFGTALSTYCDFIWSHMRAEETEVLPRARSSLLDDDWQEMLKAFSANDDPLFGARRTREFDRLYHRIANLAPRKLRLALLKPDDSAVPAAC